MKNNEQQVTVFGANGRVGRLVVAALQARGFSVVASVRGQHEYSESDTLKVVTADIYNSDDVAQAMQGSQIIISTLGSWGTTRKDVLTVGMAHIIAGMQQQSITRIVSLTGAESRAPGDTLGLVHQLMHTALRVMAPKILRDGEAHIELLSQSQLDWTVVRSPIMKDGTRYGRGELSLRRPYPWQLIGRRDVVQSIVECAVRGTWVRQAPYII